LLEDMIGEKPIYVRGLSVLKEIKSGVQSLCAGQEEERKIVEIINIEAIGNSLEQNGLAHEGTVMLIDSIVEVLLSIHGNIKGGSAECQETLSKWQNMRENLVPRHAKDHTAMARAMCETLEFLTDRVHAIRVDNANNKLRTVAPVIKVCAFSL